MKKRATAYTQHPAITEAARNAVLFCAWGRPAFEDITLILGRGGVDDPHDMARLAYRFASYFEVHAWASELLALAGRNANLFSRIRTELREQLPDLSSMQIADLLYAIEVVGSRKLGIKFREGIRALRPLRDLVAVVHLPHETATASLSPGAQDLDIGYIRTPGYFLARVLFTGPEVHPDVKPGQLVMVQDQSMPYGAGELAGEEFGLEPGRRVVLVPCKILKSPERSEELTERMMDARRLEKEYPHEKYPKNHPFWTTPLGEYVLAQLGEHVHHILQIRADRSGKGRNRLMHTADESDKCVRCDFDLGLTPSNRYCPRCGIPAQSCRTEAEGVLGIVEESIDVE